MVHRTKAGRVLDPAAYASGDLEILRESFRRSLFAENKSPATIESYTRAVRLLTEFQADRGMPGAAASIRREHVEAFISDQIGRHSAATANTRYRGLQQFFKWALAEGEIDQSPMANLSPPRLSEQSPAVLADDHVRRLVKACGGRGFADRRDMALILLFIDTGVRRHELAALSVDDIDFEFNVAVVHGKGGRQRACPFGRKPLRR